MYFAPGRARRGWRATGRSQAAGTDNSGPGHPEPDTPETGGATRGPGHGQMVSTYHVNITVVPALRVTEMSLTLIARENEVIR